MDREVIILSDNAPLVLRPVGILLEEFATSRLWDFIRIFSEAISGDEETPLGLPESATRALMALLPLSVGIDDRAGVISRVRTFGDVGLIVDALWTVNGCSQAGKVMGLYHEAATMVQSRMGQSQAEQTSGHSH